MVDFTKKQYFIGDQYSYDKLSLIVNNLIPINIINNITPIEIKNNIEKTPSYFFEHNIYVGFPRVFNYKCFSDGTFKYFPDEIERLGLVDKGKPKKLTTFQTVADSNNIDDLYSIHNHYLIELHNYCQVFYKLKKDFDFNVVDMWGVFNDKTQVPDNWSFYYYYVKNHFDNLIIGF